MDSQSAVESGVAPLIRRLFTTVGDDPYGMVEWSTRHVQLKHHSTGEILFEQDVQAPTTWSDNAVTVAASKYFCMNADGVRESSIADMIERVVQVITNWGREQGYFNKLVRASILDSLAADVCEGVTFAGPDITIKIENNIDEDAVSAFADELRYVLLTQRCSFNSPVWFNFGAHGHRAQGNACYVLDVNDTMESILETGVTEGMIFKYGSGAGMNLSKLRSSKEHLSNGGRPSGPVSFMHGYDAWAGTIKSGGRTRRAALMLGLDASHPDIAKFVNCKAEAEQKAHLLIEFARLGNTLEGLNERAIDRAILGIVKRIDSGDFKLDDVLATVQFLERVRNGAVIPDELKPFLKEKNWFDFDENEAYASVGLQNMNISVMLPDAFMKKVAYDDLDATWYLLGRTNLDLNPDGFICRPCAQGVLLDDGEGHLYVGNDGCYYEVVETVDARDLFAQIVHAAHICGDPGVQFYDTINDWSTVRHEGEILGSNPCGEFLFLPNTSCNLASIKLTAFLRQDGTIDVEGLQHTVQLLITAQDIIVAKSHYPNETIGNTTKRYRPLGLGIADLGALLMRKGYPYDSGEGRMLAQTLMALITGTAYEQSAEIGGRLGAFDGYNPNRMAEVIALHATHASRMTPWTSKLIEPVTAAKRVWERLECREDAQYRNAMVTAIAPTGTIAFMMDCSTTGMEPEIGLVRYKSLAGGGVMKLMSPIVDDTLVSLGYNEEERGQLAAWVEEYGHLEDTGILKDEHLPIFDCSLASGTRSIAPSGHVEMMAALQPFVSSGISKTVNVPHSFTEAQIAEVYVQAWRLGLKSITVYRDGCKYIQPLKVKHATEEAVASLDKWRAILANEAVRDGKERKRPPSTRRALTHKFDIAGMEGYITVGLYPDTSMPCELFINMSKQGSTLSGVMDAFSIAVSLAMQYGVPLKELINKFVHMRFQPDGWTKNREIPQAKSIIDYVFRWLAGEFLAPHEARFYGVRREDAEELVVDTLIDEHLRDPILDLEEMPQLEQDALNLSDAPACPNCGALMVRSGSCYACPSCAQTTGCS